MHLDHVAFAAGPGGTAEAVARISSELGTAFVDGGVHPRFGTRNRILPLRDRRYLEVVEVLDHPASDKAPFGQAVRARTATGGGWLAWVMALDGDVELAEVEQRLGRDAADGHRYRPDGTELNWRQIGINDVINDPQLPFFVHWPSPSPHPSEDAPATVELMSIQLAGDPGTVATWLGGDLSVIDVDVDWTEPQAGRTGIVSAVFATPRGEVRI